jgi:phosphoribosylformylglycinamidine cyclo-ligase
VKDANLDLHQIYPELDSEKTLGEVLLTPTKIYVKSVLEVIRQVDVHGVAHITGGGFDENIPRIFLPGQGFDIEEGSWEILPVFKFLESKGNIPHREMFNIFNMGIGMVLAVSEEDATKVRRILDHTGEITYVLGHVRAGENIIR